MTQQKYLSALLVCGMFVGACADTHDSVGGGSGGPDYGGSGSSGGSGSGDGSDPGGGGGPGNVDNNAGGPDDGADTMPTYQTQHPRIYLPANKTRLQAALAANTQPAMRFRDVVDRWIAGQSIYGFEVWNAALMGALTGDAKYCTKAVSEIDRQVAAEESAIAAGQQPNAAFNSYLHVGDVIGDVMLTYDWCFDRVSASQKTRWLRYANQAVWNVWHPSQAKWGNKTMTWSGWSINNASNNYYYSFLRATMLTGLAAHGEDAEADGWLTMFRDTKVLGQLVPTFDAQLRGGGSREGTAYGVSHRGLFHLYDLWEGSTGEKLQAKTKHARQSMRSFMHQMMPTLDFFVPTGDQPRDHTAAFFDYQRAYLEELVTLYATDPLAPRAKAMLDASSLPRMARGEMLAYDFLYAMDNVTAQPLEGLDTNYYASGIGHTYSRSGWDRQATWVELIGGAYTESHAHQDQGSLMIYKGGWLAYDAVVNSRSGIIQETGSHNLVQIKSSSGAPIAQAVNTTSNTVGLHEGHDWLYAAVDVTPAYKNNAAISKVQREMVFLKPDIVIVYDRVATAPGTKQTWLMTSPVQTTLAGTTTTMSGAHTLRIQRLAPASATARVTNLSGVSDYTAGYRLEEEVAGGDNRHLHVLSIDGAAVTATAANDSTVTVELSSGKTATVAFDRDSVGATLTYDGNETVLTPTVDVLPE
jgi:hypothetical protein